MTASLSKLLIGLVFVAAVAFGISTLATHATAESGTTEVRWLISHQPTDVFDNAARVFAEELSKRTDGRLSLKIVTPEDVGVAAGDIPHAQVMQLLDSGTVELATTYTVALGAEDNTLWALNLPYAFSSYAAVPNVLDGDIGHHLLADFTQNTNEEGLAFTMSGGLRIIATKAKAIRTPNDMKGLRIATSGGPVAEATLKALGATPVSLNLESGASQIDPSTIDGVETTYTRLSQAVGMKSAYTTYLNETNHSLFLTVILANKSFMASLSPADQQAMRDAATAAAQIERKDSEALANTTRDQLAASGATIIELSAANRSAFSDQTKSVYAQFSDMFGSDITNAFAALR